MMDPALPNPVPPEPRRLRPEGWLPSVWGLLVRVVIAAALLYVLYRVGFIIVVVLIAAMLALTLAPAVEWLRRSSLVAFLPPAWRKSTAVSVAFTVGALLLVLLGIVILGPLINEVQALGRNWPAIQENVGRQVGGVRQWYGDLHPSVRQWVEQHGVQPFGAVLPERIGLVLGRTVRNIEVLVELILIPILAFLFLTESQALKREFLMFVPRSRTREGLTLIRQVGIILQSYAVGQLILALIAGCVVWLLLTALHIRFALAMAVIAAITRVIPVIGPIIGAIPIVLVSALQGLDRGILVLVAFTIMHLVESKLVMPRIIGDRINLNPVLVILALLIGQEFFGMWGMFLAAPVVAVLRVLYHHFYVRPPGRGGPAPRGRTPRPAAEKDSEIERPAVAPVRTHSGAH